ncbi:hypothetical protein CEQ90_14250 [Lewinellaceae bacterium SD302]|nr:hypothetical protein CEQ90_14250 [Lewinellaceae bacterium SD302]
MEEPKPTFLTYFLSGFREWFDDFINLREGMDRAGTVESIKKGKLMRGSNAWMLVCSIMIASLGLNLNSGAVIIGAMLISPLMNPILGLGLGVATNDREALAIAFRHFLIAIAISLITSTLYFWITPLKEFTSEIAGRTKPNVLDGLVAVFGGLAGIISVSRSDKTSAIPGVAIATALMPPLCVSGYGIASGDWGIAVRAFYLFFLNSSIIACTAYLMIRIMRFPYRTYVNEREARRSQLLVAAFAALILVPSYFIMREVIQDFKIKRGIREFVTDNFDTSCLEYKYIQIKKDSNVLVMELLNRELNGDSLEFYQQKLAGKPYNVINTPIIAIPDNNINLRRLDRVQYQLSALDNMEKKIADLIAFQEEEKAAADKLQAELDVYRLDSLEFQRFDEQLRLAFPDLQSFSISRAQLSTPDTLRNSFPQVLVRRKSALSESRALEEEERLRAYLKSALRVDTILVVPY